MNDVRWHLALTMALLTLSLSVSSAHANVASPPEDVWDAAVEDGSIDMSGSRGGNGGPSRGTPMGGGAPLTHARYVFACPGNTFAADPPINLACEAAIQACNAELTTRQYVRFVATTPGGEPAPPPGSEWSFDGLDCITPAQAVEAQVTVTLADFRNLPLPAARPAIEPAGGEALIRMRTNSYVNPESTRPQTFDITLLGTPVQVRATPVSYTWDYGDGSTPVTTKDPGAPYPDLTTWHEYEQPGDVSITLTTTYTGEYSVAGGPWVEIPGTAEVASPPQPLQLLTSANRLTG